MQDLHKVKKTFLSSKMKKLNLVGFFVLLMPRDGLFFGYKKEAVKTVRCDVSKR
jgi:hypothetical protein